MNREFKLYFGHPGHFRIRWAADNLAEDCKRKNIRSYLLPLLLPGVKSMLIHLDGLLAAFYGE